MDELFLLFEWVAWRLPRELLTRQAIQLKRMWGALKGNAKPLMLCNIFWTIPSCFMGIYLQVFMVEQGMSKIEIGTVASAQLVAQMFGALLGGFLAERYGRLRTVTLIDSCCWPLAYLIFSSAHGYLSFLAGAVLVGTVFTLGPAWTALYVEGSHPSSRMHLFGLLQIPWFLGMVLSSLSGFLVSMWGVTGTCRVVFGCACAMTAFSVWLRSKYLRDPSPPRRPFQPSLSDVETLARGHWSAFRLIISSRPMYLIFIVQVLTAIFLSVSVTYNNLYLVDHRGMDLKPVMLALIPLVGGTTVLLTTFLLVPFITLGVLFRWLVIGAVLQALNITAYLVGPAGSLGFVIAGALAGAVGFGVYNPVLNGYWSNLMSDRDRPRILAFTTVASMLVTMPAPTIAGALFTIHPSGPLFMQLGVFLLICSCFLLAVRVRRTR